MTGLDLQRRRIALGLSADALGELVNEHAQQVESWERTSAPLPASLTRRLEWILATQERERQLVAAGHPPCELAKQAFGDPKPGNLASVEAAAERVEEHARSCQRCQAREAYLATLPALPDPPFPVTFRLMAGLIQIAERLPPMLRPALYGACLLGVMTIVRGVVMLAVSPRSLSPKTALMLLAAMGIGAYGGAVGGVAYGLVRPRTRRFGRGGDYLTGIACVYAYMLAFLVPLALLGVEPLLYTRMGAGVFVLLGTIFGLVVGHFWFRDDPAENGGV